MKTIKTYQKEQIISKFKKLGNKKKVEILMKVLADAEGRTDIPQDDFIIFAMGYKLTYDKQGYINLSDLPMEFTEEELVEIKRRYNL